MCIKFTLLCCVDLLNVHRRLRMAWLKKFSILPYQALPQSPQLLSLLHQYSPWGKKKKEKADVNAHDSDISIPCLMIRLCKPMGPTYCCWAKPWHVWVATVSLCCCRDAKWVRCRHGSSSCLSKQSNRQGLSAVRGLSCLSVVSHVNCYQ